MRPASFFRDRADIIGLALGVAVALPSLLYPFGADQAVFHYIGAGWAEGNWPYTSAVDHKPPGVHALYALCAWLFGSTEWPIRALDAVGILALGASVPRAVLGRGPASGERGACALLAAALYYSVFDYWDTAQVELWEGLALLRAWIALGPANTRPSAGACARAGALVALAFLFKYPAAVVAIAIAAAIAWRTGRSAAIALAAYAGGSAGVVALAGGILAGGGAIAAFWESTVLFNLAHADQVGGPRSVLGFWIGPGKALAVGLGLGVSAFGWRAWQASRAPFEWRPAATWMIALAAFWLSIALQRKFWLYHHVVLVPVWLCAVFYALGELAPEGRRIRLLAVASALLLLLGPAWPRNDGRPRLRYLSHARLAALLSTGALDREGYVGSTVRGADERDARALGRALAARRRPGDDLCVLGYAPMIYLESDLRCPSRFFVTLVLAGAPGEFHEGAWRREFAASIRASPPRYFAAKSVRPLEALDVDYREIEARGQMKLFERVR